MSVDSTVLDMIAPVEMIEYQTVTVDPNGAAAFAAASGDAASQRHGLAPLLYLPTRSQEPFVRMVAGLLGWSALGLLHLSRSVECTGAVRPGDSFSSSVQPISFRKNRGGGVLEILTLFSVDGDETMRMVDGMQVLGPQVIEDFGTPVERGAPLRKKLHTIGEIDVATDVTQRWAEASGDHQQIHLDDAVARQFGFEGVIAHGTYTMASVFRLLVDELADGDASRVARVLCRFSKPVYPGDKIVVAAASDDGSGTIRFRCTARKDRAA